MKTEQADQAAHALSELHHGRLRLRVADDNFAFTQNVLDDGTVSMGLLGLSGKTECVSDGFDTVIIGRAVSGEHRWQVGTERGAGPRAFVIPPGRILRTQSKELVLQAVSFQPSAMARAVQLPGEDTKALAFAETVNQDAADLLLLHRTLEYVARVQQDPVLVREPLVQASLLHHVAAVTSTTFGVVPDMSPRRLGSRAVRHAMMFMDEHAGDPITVADVAAAAGVSVRALQQAFRRSQRPTPTSYLRTARLDRAHQELWNTDPAVGTVNAIAARWGFSNRGRFARLYRDAYGVNAGTTLQQGR